MILMKCLIFKYDLKHGVFFEKLYNIFLTFGDADF